MVLSLSKRAKEFTRQIADDAPHDSGYFFKKETDSEVCLPLPDGKQATCAQNSGDSIQTNVTRSGFFDGFQLPPLTVLMTVK
jgi:hypothetical protein